MSAGVKVAGPQPTAVRTAYRGLLLCAGRMCGDALSCERGACDASAQTAADIAAGLLDLTPMLFRVLNSAAPSLEEWAQWSKRLTDLATATLWPALATENELSARRLLTRMLAVRWGDDSSMAASLPRERGLLAGRARARGEA